MPGILHKAKQPNWPDEPFIEGAMEEQETTCAAHLGGGSSGGWRLGITVILQHMPQASLKLQKPLFILF